MIHLRKLNGVFPVIKPVGITSANFCNKLRDKLQIELEFEKFGFPRLKIGHGGTLDSNARGVLAVGLGTGCSLLSHFLHTDKEYVCTACLGVSTNTLEAGGDIIETKQFGHVDEVRLIKALQQFIGNKEQIPPNFSALKYQGRRLSDRAIKGEEMPHISPRVVRLHAAECISFMSPFFTIKLKCGGGFYVRSLIRDLGHALHSCAYVVDLERSSHGVFTSSDAIEMSDFCVDKVIDTIELVQLKFKSFSTNIG